MSTALSYFCCDERRRGAVRKHATLNGIDFLEVHDHGFPLADRQRELLIHFLKPLSVALIAAVTARQIVVTIRGGVRVTGITVDPAKTSLDGTKQILTVWVNQPGDFSTYTLTLGDAAGQPFAGLDPLLSSVDFSFKIECGGDFDCKEEKACPPERRAEPEIDYLAKDYGSFRRLMLDRMSLLLPGFAGRGPADLGVTLVELLAHVGDQLSYTQDAIATEAYLGTAQRRVSVRRHARLLDYAMHDGCNARAWLVIDVAPGGDGHTVSAGTRVFTSSSAVGARIAPGSEEEKRLLKGGAVGFETMEAIVLRDHTVSGDQAPGEIEFYTWGERECCLPRGATRATLRGDRTKLRPGMVLIFEEVRGPRTGRPEDADPTHRHAVRLTSVDPPPDPPSRAPRVDPAGGRFLDPETDDAVPITEIAWGDEDALPFPLCLSAVADIEHGSLYWPRVSIARGNVVLADHGVTVTDPPFDPVPPPDPRLAAVSSSGCEPCNPSEPVLAPLRYRPRLAQAPITQVARVRGTGAGEDRPGFNAMGSAASALRWSMDQVLPSITLQVEGAQGWSPRRDLLSSEDFARDFVVEIDNDSRASLRFGDDQNGARPAVGTRFAARYRVGNGTSGNVGADTLSHLVINDDQILAVRNPLPARGGVDPEPIEQVRHNAPSAFFQQERAVTPEDYAEVAQRHPAVQRAMATIRWTGSWRTVFLTVDRFGGRPVDAAFEAELRDHLERFRMAGQDVEIDGPRYVPLEIEAKVCVLPGYFRSDVRQALLRVLSAVDVPGVGRGVFHPDNFSFGEPVYLSRLTAAAQAVTGVRSVELTTFQRLGLVSPKALESGALTVDRLEIARLDNDPNYPERGVLRLTMEGGR